MGSSLHLNFMILYLVSLLFYLNKLVAHSLSPPHPPLQPIIHCDAGDSSALLQFKESFVIDKLASSDPLAYPKVRSWSSQGDCCSWDGVLCDENDGHVIGLDLSSSCLFGSINSDSSLFRLRHLRMLSLADNNFNYSRIPPELVHLSSTLTRLDLSSSCFSGQIPAEISRLSKLSVLDLSVNVDAYQRSLLQLNPSTFENLVQNATSLEQLVLGWVDISSKVPNTLANLSSLSLLYLRSCNLQGEFPSRVFLLPNLEFLSIRFNRELTGRLPHFYNHSQLKLLFLGGTSFSGELPYSIQNLHSLTQLDLSDAHFSGPIPSSFGNLTKLTYLDFSFNNWNAVDMSWLVHLTNLQYLCFQLTNMSSEIPSSLESLTKLEYLWLVSCQLSGHIPIWIQNFTQLRVLDFSYNFLQGPIPESIFYRLVRLEYLNFYVNNLSGTLEFDQFRHMTNLTSVYLGYNPYLSVVDCKNCFGILPNLMGLDLSSCNFTKFPSLLKHQHKLSYLSLRSNKIHGPIPTWIWNTSKDTLLVLDVSHNSLTGFEQNPRVLSWVNLEYLDISFNLLQGSLPVPPPFISYYFATGNKLAGKIPSVICNSSYISVLDLAFNNLSGKLPQCLRNITNLSILRLQNNNFHGSIPRICGSGSKLEIIHLGANQWQGKMPRSLAGCAMLRELNLGENQIDDTFPFWLGQLQFLQLLILRSNKFHGAISESFSSHFPNLRIIDLSHNGFSGHLPSAYFRIWKGMEKSNASHWSYLGTNRSFHFRYSGRYSVYQDTMVLANKGTDMEYAKIPDVLAAMDFSSNNFSGEIPGSIGNLNGLYVLNLSNNHLTGRIPSSLANLTELESLDLSRNQLSGEIPHQLADLNYLEFFNVSGNNLTGHVPRGKQLDTFQDNSFEGNSGLCGELLIAKRCTGDFEKSRPSSPAGGVEGNDHVEFLSRYDWIVIAMGYASGLVVGFVIGNTVMARKPQWFVKIFGRRMQLQTQRKSRRRSRRN